MKILEKKIIFFSNTFTLPSLVTAVIRWRAREHFSTLRRGVVYFSVLLRTPFLSFRCRISWFAAEWASGSVRVADPLISGSNSTD